MSDGTLYGHLYYQLTKNKTTFITGAPDMTEWPPKGCVNFCMTVEKAGTINQVWTFPYYYQRRDASSRWGFLCVNQNSVAEADLPYKYKSKIDGWGVQIVTYLFKFLLKEANDVLNVC